MQLAALIQLVWQAVLGVWSSEEVADDEQSKRTPFPTSTSAVVVYSTVTKPSYTMPALFSFSSLLSLLSMFVLSIMYLSQLPERLFANGAWSYYQALSQRQDQELQRLIAQNMANESDKENLESEVAQLQSITGQHQAQLQTEQQNHAAEIEKLKTEHAGKLQQLQQIQQQASEHQSAILATAMKDHVAQTERLKTEHAHDLQHLRATHERATEQFEAIAATASEDRSMVESSLREALGSLKLKHRQLQTSSERDTLNLEKTVEALQRRLYDAQQELKEPRFVGQEEWAKLRAEKREAVATAYGLGKERDIYHTQLREVCATSVKQSQDVADATQAAATATERMNDMQAQLTQKDEELAKTLKRNVVLLELVRKVQADVDERTQALRKAEEEGTKIKRELERLKKRQPKKQATATRQDCTKGDGKPLAVKADRNPFDRHAAIKQDLHDARAQVDKLMEKVAGGEARENKATEELKSLSGELTASKLETLATRTELDRVRMDLEAAQKTSSDSQASLKAARNELTELKGAEARVVLASDAASKAQNDLTKAKAELHDNQETLSALKSELGDARAEVFKLKAEQLERETVFQKYQAFGQRLELEVNHLRQINAGLVNSNAGQEHAQVALGNLNVELGNIKAELDNTKSELENTKVALENTTSELGHTKVALENSQAELLGLKAQQMGREAALQKCQENKQQFELQVNNLRQTNANLGQEISSLKTSLDAAQAEVTSRRQSESQQHEAAVGTGQEDLASTPSGVENQDPYTSGDDAMEQEYQLWEDALPGTFRPEASDTAKEDQHMEGEIVGPLAHEEAPLSTVPGVPDRTRELDDIDLDLLGENDSDEPEAPNDHVHSSGFTVPQFNFMAPQNIAWPTSNVTYTFDSSPQENPEEQPTQDEDTARMIEEELEKDLENDEWLESSPEAPNAGPELIYGDYLPATQPEPQQALSSLLYGARSQAHNQEVPHSTSPSILLGQTDIATPPRVAIPGLFQDASTEGQSRGVNLPLESKNRQVATPAASSVQPETSSPSSQSLPTAGSRPVFDPSLMSLNDWALPQEAQAQSSMANFVPEPFIPTVVPRSGQSSITRSAPPSVPYPPSPFTVKPRSNAPVGAFSRAMYDVQKSPIHPSSTTKPEPKNPVGAFSQAMYGMSKTPSHTLIVDNSPPSFLTSLIKPTAQTPTVSHVHSQALRYESQYTSPTEPDPRSKRLANQADASGSQVPRFNLGVMSLPGASGQVGFSQTSPHYAVQADPASLEHTGPATLGPVRRGFASLPPGNQPSIPDVATLSALLAHRTPAEPPVAESTCGPSVPILHPRNPHAEAEGEVQREEEIEGVLQGQVVIDIEDESTSDEDETEEERKARKLAKLAPRGQRKIAKLRKRRPAA
ncbi:hypothetical protein MMC32_006827 [Xylographa parallela]|nr:hypothetical protein [Xylographa parallela]